MRRTQTYSLPDEIIQEIRKRAKHLDKSASDLVSVLLRDALAATAADGAVINFPGKLKTGPKPSELTRSTRLVLETLISLHEKSDKGYFTVGEVEALAPAQPGVVQRSLRELALLGKVIDGGWIRNPSMAVGASMGVRVYGLPGKARMPHDHRYTAVDYGFEVEPAYEISHDSEGRSLPPSVVIAELAKRGAKVQEDTEYRKCLPKI